MAAPRSVALALLALFMAPALVSAATRSLTVEQSTLEGMQKDCLDDATAGYGLKNAACKECMKSLGDRTDLMWACGAQVCQNADLFNNTYNAEDVDCAGCVAANAPVICQLCNRDVPLNEYSALVTRLNKENPVTAVEADIIGAREWCTDCSTYAKRPAGVAAGSVPPFADANSNGNTFRAACSVCANIPAIAVGSDENDWRAWCLQCIWTPTAQPLPAGTLQYADWMQLKNDKQTRPVDYGACAYHANHSYYVDKGWIKPDGIYATCTNTAVAPSGGGPVFTPPVSADNVNGTVYGDTSRCVSCMETALNYASMGGPTPDNTSKAYACANCRHPDWVKSKNETEQCFACVKNANVYNAWGCNFCFEEQFLAANGNRGDVIAACVGCQVANPYQGKVGAYPWACAQCAGIVEEDVRTMCNTCILTPAINLGYNITSGIITPSADLTAALDDKGFIGNATELICSCIDMAKASTWGSGTLADWYTNLCPDCTAMQKTCYKRRNITWTAIPGPDGGPAEDPRPPFVKLPRGAPLPINGSSPFPYKLMDCDAYNYVVLTAEETKYLIVMLAGNDCAIKNGVVRMNGTLECAGSTKPVQGGVTVGACTVAVPFDFTHGYMLIHIDDVIATGESVPGDDCVQCMREFTLDADKSDEDAYACEQYCMNPYTIRSEAQFLQCMTCIKGEFIDAVYVCDACIQAFNSYLPMPLGDITANADENLLRRDSCMTCAMTEQTLRPDGNPEYWPVSSRDWACVECARFENSTTRANCMTCLEDATLDPCVCVDGFKRGFLPYTDTAVCYSKYEIDVSLGLTAPAARLLGGSTLDAVAGPDNAGSCSAMGDKMVGNNAYVFGLTCSNGNCTGADDNVCYWVSFLIGKRKKLYSEGASLMVLGRAYAALQHVQEQRLDTAALGESYHGLDTLDSEACMEHPILIARTDLMWPCTSQCAACVAEDDPVVCLLCMNMVPSTYSDLVDDQVLAARDWCVQAATYHIKATDVAAGDGTAPAFADINVDVDKFSAAVSACANIPDADEKGKLGDAVSTDWKDWCLKCLWSPTAQPKPAGTLEFADWAAMQAANPKQTRLTDYGACAFQANQSYYIEAGLIDPVGIRETCVWKADEFQPPVVGGKLPVVETIIPCLDCMGRMYEYTDMPGFAGDQPIGTSKAYACALFATPTGSRPWPWPKIASSVFNPNVYNPWGCNHCYEASFLAGVTDPAVAAKCTKCVTDNPYEDKVGSYNWACAECAAIADPEIKDLCIACIMTPALGAGYAKASTWDAGTQANWYTSACPECTAQQRSGYKIRK
ncbi:hypothetical protein FOA52_003317 [Chlamydomonas sp. UWO 241]|nr:hypothetical protein FOA52_003317 [Chlamydomonas sp. UWO 241]